MFLYQQRGLHLSEMSFVAIQNTFLLASCCYLGSFPSRWHFVLPLLDISVWAAAGFQDPGASQLSGKLLFSLGK